MQSVFALIAYHCLHGGVLEQVAHPRVSPACSCDRMLVKKVPAALQLQAVQAENKVQMPNALVDHFLDSVWGHALEANVVVQYRELCAWRRANDPGGAVTFDTLFCK